MWGVSPQPPVCRIHLDDATAATGQWRQCTHHTPHDLQAVCCAPSLYPFSSTGLCLPFNSALELSYNWLRLSPQVLCQHLGCSLLWFLLGRLNHLCRSALSMHHSCLSVFTLVYLSSSLPLPHGPVLLGVTLFCSVCPFFGLPAFVLFNKPCFI